MKNRKMLIVVISILLYILLIPNFSNAGLQANKGGKALIGQTVDNFFPGIRKMETVFGTLGKKAELEDTTYKDTTGNGIDCHMILTTEYGTAAMLAYSVYGEVNYSTTSGNNSGIMGLKGYTAGMIGKPYYATKIYNADSRYRNVYSGINKIGDGLGILGKPSASNSGNYIFLRWNLLDGIWNGNGKDGGEDTIRAVVVCGPGL